jgi:hypothetical protein
MKTKHLLGFTLFITTALLLTGCGKAKSNLESENASLKAHVQKLEQQLKESNTRIASQGSAQPGLAPATNLDLTSQLDEAQKKAEAAANDLAAISSQVEAQKAAIDKLTRELTEAQQARQRAEKALLLYQEKAATAVKEFKTLRSTLGGTNTMGGTNTLGGTNAMLSGYHQKYLAMQKTVTNAVGVLPDAKVRREILGVLALFTRIDETWETADRAIQARASEAKADYDKFVDFGGIGPNDTVVKMGTEKILMPAAEENAATAARRDLQMVSSVKDVDLGIKNLQDLLSGQRI